MENRDGVRFSYSNQPFQKGKQNFSGEETPVSGLAALRAHRATGS